MGVADHEASAADTQVRFGIIVVTTSRTAATDETGPALRDAVASEGHHNGYFSRVADSREAIRGALVEATDAGCRVVLVTGGTGLSSLDVTPEAIEPLFDRWIPGFGELFRRRSVDEVGHAGILSRASAGIVGLTAVFLLPGSRNACATATPIVFGIARHLVHQMDKERSRAAPAPAAPAEEALPSDAELSGWLATLAEHQGSLDRDASAQLPGSVATSALDAVFSQAGDRCVVRFADEDPGVLYGFPDLVNPRSRVLLVRGGRPFGDIVALHRPASALVAREGGWMGAAADLELISRRWTGEAIPGEGQIFAVDGEVVHVVDEGRIDTWDGRERTPIGEPEDVALSLVREWAGS